MFLHRGAHLFKLPAFDPHPGPREQDVSPTRLNSRPDGHEPGPRALGITDRARRQTPDPIGLLAEPPDLDGPFVKGFLMDHKILRTIRSATKPSHRTPYVEMCRSNKLAGLRPAARASGLLGSGARARHATRLPPCFATCLRHKNRLCYGRIRCFSQEGDSPPPLPLTHGPDGRTLEDRRIRGNRL